MTNPFRSLFSLFSGNSKQNESLKQKFSDIYANNAFGGRLSRSGEGSGLIQTEVIRREIPKLIADLGVRTLADAPCGDLFWMKQVELGVEKYIGIDIVDELIERNKGAFGASVRQFHCLNIIADPLPTADIVLCRDCLVHLNYGDAISALRNFKRAGYKYLLTTTFTDRRDNVDLSGKKSWRPLNLQLAPFYFPAPIKLINEKCTEEKRIFADKSLGLWLMDSIHVDS